MRGGSTEYVPHVIPKYVPQFMPRIQDERWRTGASVIQKRPTTTWRKNGYEGPLYHTNTRGRQILNPPPFSEKIYSGMAFGPNFEAYKKLFKKPPPTPQQQQPRTRPRQSSKAKYTVKHY